MNAPGTTAAPGVETSTAERTQRRSRFFVAAAALMLLIVFMGFAPTFYLRGFIPGANLFPVPAYVYAHGAVMTAWYLLFLAQACLVASGRKDLHQRLGIVGVALAVAVVFTGIPVLLNMVSRLESTGLDVAQQLELLGVDRIVIAGFGSLVAFAGFVLAAVLLRRDGPSHRRLMYWGAVVTLGAALNSNRMLGAMLLSVLPTWLPVVPVVGFGCLALYDWAVARRIHPATLYGAIGCLVVVALAKVLGGSGIGRALVISLAHRGG